jgi:hypothetical protein
VGKSIKAGLVAVAAIIVGSAMARGLPHHAAAPAAASPGPGGGAGSLGNVVLLFLLLLFLSGSALWMYHVRKVRELRMREAKLDRFVNVRRSDLADLWRCPDCHGLILLADIDDHQDQSACAEIQRWREAAAAATEGEIVPPSFMATQVDSEHVSSTVPPEHSVTTGGYDSIED